VQAEIEPLIYAYFGLTSQDVILVEDTCSIFDKSDTPASLDAAAGIPTLLPIAVDGLQKYADMLTSTLNFWATGPARVSAAGYVDSEAGLGLVELQRTHAPRAFEAHRSLPATTDSMLRLQEASAEHLGRLLLQRSAWFLDRERILLFKPARAGNWTRTAALNDAAEIYGYIAENRRGTGHD
jgi:hypothetical protein